MPVLASGVVSSLCRKKAGAVPAQALVHKEESVASIDRLSDAVRALQPFTKAHLSQAKFAARRKQTLFTAPVAALNRESHAIYSL